MRTCQNYFHSVVTRHILLNTSQELFREVNPSVLPLLTAEFPLQFKHQMTWEHAVWLSCSLKVTFCDIKLVRKTLFSLSILLFTHISIWIMMHLWLRRKEINWMPSRNTMIELSRSCPAKTNVLWWWEVVGSALFQIFFKRKKTGLKHEVITFCCNTSQEVKQSSFSFYMCSWSFFMLTGVFF